MKFSLILMIASVITFIGFLGALDHFTNELAQSQLEHYQYVPSEFEQHVPTEAEMLQ